MEAQETNISASSNFCIPTICFWAKRWWPYDQRRFIPLHQIVNNLLTMLSGRSSFDYAALLFRFYWRLEWSARLL